MARTYPADMMSKKYAWLLVGSLVWVAIFGTAVPTSAQANVSPASIDFGNQSVGILTCAQTVSITNGGATTITVMDASTAAPFALTGFSGPTQILPGEGLDLGVSYSPTAAGASNGTLSISFDVLPQSMVTLSGTGAQTDATGMIPLIDMGQNRTYLGFSGGLYENGCNIPPPDHDAMGRAHAAVVTPLDADGNPDSNGKIVFLSLGLSNTSLLWCGFTQLPDAGNACLIPTNNSFMEQAAADPGVNHTTLVILDGAASAQQAITWVNPSDANYDRVQDAVLGPAGLTQSQVQALWVMEANAQPTVSLASGSADAFTLETELGDIVRAAKVRYPNLRLVFFTSREYAGYATTTLNPEPFAYESGYSVKFLIQAQIDQMRNGGTVVDSRAGDLNYNTGVAPFLVWSVYDWAKGNSPRSDGLVWLISDFQADGTHPSPSGIQKVGTLLLNYFLSSPYAGWFKSAP